MTSISKSARDIAAYRTLENGQLSARIQAVRERLGPRLLILGHHYQQDEVIGHSDLRGDSYQLSKMAAEGLPAISPQIPKGFMDLSWRNPIVYKKHPLCQQCS